MITERARAAFHEGGHAIAGTLIYGDGFVIKIRMTGGDPRTQTRVEKMGNQPLRRWQGDRLVKISTPDALDSAEALGVSSLAGMAADWIAHNSYQPSPQDIRSLNTVLARIDDSLWTLIEPTPDALPNGVLSEPHYIGWFLDARELLTAHRAALDLVAAWLLKRDTLRGPAVEAIIHSEGIRE